MSKLFCMKGVPYTEKRLLEWLTEDGAVVCQVKRDEIRCIVEVNLAHHHTHDDEYTVSYTSASGKPLYNLAEHDAMWMDIARISGLRKFDTGVSIEDRFDLTRRVVLSSKKVYSTRGSQLYDIKEVTKKVTTFEYTGNLQARFWLYDLPDLQYTYEARRSVMANIAGGVHSQYIATPETEVVYLPGFKYPALEDAIAWSAFRVSKFYEKCLEHKHEGAMVKRFCHEYKEGRTTEWMKLKPSEDVDVRITGYVAGEGKFKGLIGSLIGVAEDGSTVYFSGFTDDVRVRITENIASIISERWVAEVRYMQRDSAGGYRHPRFYRWHPDK